MNHYRRRAVDLLMTDANMDIEDACVVTPRDVDFSHGLIRLSRKGGMVAYITTDRLLRGLVDMVKTFNDRNYQSRDFMKRA